jgi:hypothetical protein
VTEQILGGRFRRERLVGLLLAADIWIERQFRWNLSIPQSGSNLREQAFSTHTFYASKRFLCSSAKRIKG